MSEPSGSAFLAFYPRFREPVLTGVKTKTARTKRYGAPGDVLRTPFGDVRLVAVERVSLADVAEKHWREEGTSGPEEFKAVWSQIHPLRGFRPDDLVWLHRFEVVRDAPETRSPSAGRPARLTETSGEKTRGERT